MDSGSDALQTGAARATCKGEELNTPSRQVRNAGIWYPIRIERNFY